MIIATLGVNSLSVNGWRGKKKRILLSWSEEDRSQKMEALRNMARESPVGIFAELNGNLLSVLSPQVWTAGGTSHPLQCGFASVSGDGILEAWVTTGEIRIWLTTLDGLGGWHVASAAVSSFLPDEWGGKSASSVKTLEISALRDPHGGHSVLTARLWRGESGKSASPPMMQVDVAAHGPNPRQCHTSCAIHVTGGWPKTFPALVLCLAGLTGERNEVSLALMIWPNVPDVLKGGDK